MLEERRPVTMDQLGREPGRDCRQTPGMNHDYRPRTVPGCWNKPYTALVCVWCDAITCGDHDQADPCMEPYHHRGDHVSRFGVRWPLGEMRPDVHLAGA